MCSKKQQRFVVLVVALLLSQCSYGRAFSTPPNKATVRRIFFTTNDKNVIRSVELSSAVRNRVETIDQYAMANAIHPRTKSIRESVQFYVRFVLRSYQEHRRAKRQRQQKKADPTQEETSSLRQMFRSMNEQRKNLVALAEWKSAIVVPSFTFLLLGAFMASVTPHFYSECIQCVAVAEVSRRKCVTALMGLAIASTLEALFTGLRGSLFWMAGSRSNYNVRVKLHRNLLLQEAAFFDSTETGYLLSRLNSDVNKIGQVISYHVNVVLRQFAQFVFGSIYLIRISPKLSLAAFAGIGLVAWISAVYGAFARVLAEQVQDTYASGTAVAETSFHMSETVRAFDGVKVESDKYEDSQGKALELEEVQALAYGTHKFVSDTVQTTLQVLLLFVCWSLGRAAKLPASSLTTFMFYTNFVLESSNEVGDQWAKIQSAVGASTSVFDLIRRLPRVRDPPKTPTSTTTLSAEPVSTDGDSVQFQQPTIVDDETVVTTNHSSKQNPSETTPSTSPIISMSNMTVTYGALEAPALNNVCLDINPGDRIAIVGRSGSGKSSMLRSILRFYDPSSGTIRLEGKDLKEMSRKEIASKISIVEQEPSLFPLTLMENVLYGIDKDDVDPKTGEPCYSEKYRAAVAESLRLAGLSTAPGNDLGLSLDTRVGEGGRTLSGGQRQRVAIARALIRHPQVLLLDEPTAALDSESEKKVVRALQSAMEYCKSMIMVTHRLGVVRSLGVNRVIVMDGGKIAETGHPDELLQKDGLYARLAREQGIVAENSPFAMEVGRQ